MVFWHKNMEKSVTEIMFIISDDYIKKCNVLIIYFQFYIRISQKTRILVKAEEEWLEK